MRVGRESVTQGTTYAEHLPEVWVPEAEGDVGDVEPLGLGLVVGVFGGLCLGWPIRRCCVICLLKGAEQTG